MTNELEFEIGTDFHSEKGHLLTITKRYRAGANMVDLLNKNTGEIETYPRAYAISKVQENYWKFLSGPGDDQSDGNVNLEREQENSRTSG